MISLTYHWLRLPAVKARFSRTFHYPALTLKMHPVAPVLSLRQSAIGTIFDLALKLYLMNLNRPVTTVGYRALNDLTDIGNWREALTDEWLRDHTPATSPKLGNWCLQVALGAGAMGIRAHRDMADLKGLVAAIRPETFRARRLLVLQPRIGTGSEHLFPGAVPDMILDGTLIDVKTVAVPHLDRDTLNQLMAYYSFGTLIGFTPEVEVRSIGIYFSRFALLFTLPVTTLIDFAEWPRFQRWLRREIDKMWATADGGPPSRFCRPKNFRFRMQKVDVAMLARGSQGRPTARSGTRRQMRSEA